MLIQEGSLLPLLTSQVRPLFVMKVNLVDQAQCCWNRAGALFVGLQQCLLYHHAACAKAYVVTKQA